MNLEKWRGRVLIVDDEPDVREVISDSLSGFNFEIVEAEDGFIAKKLIEQSEFDVIVTDMQMPNMSGLELMAYLKSVDSVVPVVVVTAYGDRGRILDALRLGAFDFIEKPFSFEATQKIINRAAEIGSRRHKISDLRARIPQFDDHKRTEAEKVIQHEEHMVNLLVAMNASEAREK